MLTPDDEALFRQLVLQSSTLTLAAIRERMSPILKNMDDIPLIQKMLGIRREGENLNGYILEAS